MKTFTVCGTPEYIAPCVISGKGHGVSADIWSLGVLFFEMLSGKPPFRGKNHIELFDIILSGVYTVPENFSLNAKSLVQFLN